MVPLQLQVRGEKGKVKRGNVEGPHLQPPRHAARTETADNGCPKALAPEETIVLTSMIPKRRDIGHNQGAALREADPLQGKGEPIRNLEESLRLQLGRSKRQELPHQVAQTQNLAQNTSAENVQKATNATFGIHQSVNIMPMGTVVKVTNVPSYTRDQRVQRRQRRPQLQNPKRKLGRGQAARSGRWQRPSKVLVFCTQPETVCKKQRKLPGR